MSNATKTAVAKSSVKSGKAKKKSKLKKAKKVASPADIAKRKQKSSVRALFARMGFQRSKSDGIEFTFDGRTGEVDDIFVWENIVIVAEYTIGAPSSEHITKKSILYSKISDKPAEWIVFSKNTFKDFNVICSQSSYLDDDYRVRICYFSNHSVSDELECAYPFIYFLNGTNFRYFDALSKTIHKSSRFEFFKYLGLDFKEIGKEINSTSTQSRAFRGHVLPEGFSSFPKGFKITSFYADPSTLLMLSYVLRRDSWRDEEGMYQRVLQRVRMSQMRRYLTSEKRVC